MARQPDFVIVGAMRAGTTTLARQLESLDGISLAPAKELHYFDRNHHRGPQWYAEQLGDGGGVVGEATPNYLYHPEALARLAGEVPAVKVVVTLRDPAARAWSHYWHNIRRGKETLDFAAALAAEPGRIARGGLDRDHYSYVDRGRYADQLAVVGELFAPAQVHVVAFEDHVAEPVASLRALAGFLGVGRPDPRQLTAAAAVRVNEAVRFRSVSLRNRSRRWPAPVKRVIGRLNAVPTPNPPMTAADADLVQRRLRVSSPA